MSHYNKIIVYDEEHGEFIAVCKDFPHLSGIDRDQVKALEILEEAIDDGIEMLREEGLPIPEVRR